MGGKLHLPTLSGNNESVSCLKARCTALRTTPGGKIQFPGRRRRQRRSRRCSRVCRGTEVGKQVASAIKSSSCNYCHKNEQNAARHKKMWPRMNVMLSPDRSPCCPLLDCPGCPCCLGSDPRGWLRVLTLSGAAAAAARRERLEQTKRQGEQIHIAVTDTATDRQTDTDTATDTAPDRQSDTQTDTATYRYRYRLQCDR